MKNTIVLCISCLLFFNIAGAQMNHFLAPKSEKYEVLQQGIINEFKLPPLTARDSQQMDFSYGKGNQMPSMAFNRLTNITPSNAGNWTYLPGLGRVWRVKVTSPGALALAPIFDKLYLPAGATLHFYTTSRQETLGAFTHNNTPAARPFCSGLIHGESCIVEYFEPLSEAGKGIISLKKIGHAYRWVDAPGPDNEKSSSGPCEVNVACSEGDNWTDQIKSVVRIFVVAENSDGYCSGTLVNNVRRDCTPYILSAFHCTQNVVTANDFQSWVFLFNYRGSTCADTSGPQNDIVNGCTEIASSNDDYGSRGSDFLLLQLNSNPPADYNVYYSGWDATDSVPQSGVCISYPEADIEKISTYNNSAISTSWGDTAQNTHWQVVWVATPNGHGVTEPGSSGSPLYGQNKLVRGHLTGGNSCCTVDGCSSNPNDPTGPDLPDLFGQTTYDWTNNGTNPNVQLKPWLDPDNTGTLQLNGMLPPCGSNLANDGGLQAINKPVGNICTSDFTPQVVIRNFGGDTLSSININYRFDQGTVSTYFWSGVLPPGFTSSVNLPNVSLTSGNHTFTVFTSNPNNSTDPNLSNDTLISPLFISNPGGSLALTLTTDNSGSKTTWQLNDAAGNTVASGGPYPDLRGGTTYNIPLCLPVACYSFTIFSSQGNGMNDGVPGNFQLTGDNGTITYASLSATSFGAQLSDTFCLLPEALTNLPAIQINITPNPSTGQFAVSMGSPANRLLQVYNITGKLILTKVSEDENVILDLSTQSRGVYILRVEEQGVNAFRKLVLK